MAAMQSFTTFFLSNLPAFFMAEPVCYFVGLIILSVCFKLILSLRG